MRRRSVCIAFLMVMFVAMQVESFGAAAAALKAIPASGSPTPQGAKKITVPAGTRILVRMVDSIDSSKQSTGYRFTASLETNLQVDDVVNHCVFLSSTADAEFRHL